MKAKKESMRKGFKNDLKKIIEQKYHTTTFTPTQQLLDALEMTELRFKNIFHQRAKITVEEAANLMAHFNITIGQLMGTKRLYTSKRVAPKVIPFEGDKFRKSILNKHGAGK